MSDTELYCIIKGTKQLQFRREVVSAYSCMQNKHEKSEFDFDYTVHSSHVESDSCLNRWQLEEEIGYTKSQKSYLDLIMQRYINGLSELLKKEIEAKNLGLDFLLSSKKKYVSDIELLQKEIQKVSEHYARLQDLHNLCLSKPQPDKPLNEKLIEEKALNSWIPEAIVNLYRTKQRYYRDAKEAVERAKKEEGKIKEELSTVQHEYENLLKKLQVLNKIEFGGEPEGSILSVSYVLDQMPKISAKLNELGDQKLLLCKKLRKNTAYLSYLCEREELLSMNLSPRDILHRFLNFFPHLSYSTALNQLFTNKST